ncbi:type III-A CRISPR-associated RAMP protein Csm5 [Lyngbya sp. CCY1209]|uniref:type III-A CRISPR-associated RAMP protein Csm5 n=1 Tax=Lyngbya sp. CCY1209 TaxID=2886103 RepID=UPI002D21760B|nr:type III-A CRISPR-associated RAMP protein Csm5 [Lyngbya sp. CCY1209]MEB3887257.1 type III-A CRISPR-associated RAMP protein Csm5 [Lyngbya sp. CCY1209]
MVASSNLSKPQVYETRTITLSSPLLHIGSAVSRLNPFEYVQTRQKVYLPDQEALARELRNRGKLQDYIGAIERREELTGILQSAFGERWHDAEDSVGNRIFPEAAIDAKWTDERVTDLRPMIRNGFGQLYIPGTSIKGAIRTAIAYYLLKNDQEYGVPNSNRVSAIEQRLRQQLNNGELKQRSKWADDRLFMDSLFSDFSLNYQGKSISARTGPNTDIMRAVQVTDSQPLIKRKVTLKNNKIVTFNIPAVAEVIVSSHFEDWNAKYRASIYAEVVRNVKTTFALALDTEMLSWFKHKQGMKIPFHSVDELLNICQTFAQDQWDGEYDYWAMVKNKRHQGKNLDFEAIRDFYEKEECPYNLRIGWASGMTGTTVGWLFKDDLRKQIRDTCGIRAPNFEAPKSRRTVVDPRGDIKYVPGWVRFKG